jgi:hypothetical protein
MSGYDYLLSQGWTPIAAAGIMGNAYGESGFDPNAVGDGGAAHGLFQIHPNYHPGYSPSFTGDQQVAFVSNELKTKYSGLAKTLNSASNVADATKAFMTGWEKPANLSSLGKRINAAGKILNGQLGDAVAMGANILLPGSGEILKAIGVGGDSCGPICQFRKWLDESHFWQRLAIGVLAIIILMLAIWMLGNKMNINIAKQGK